MILRLIKPAKKHVKKRTNGKEKAEKPKEIYKYCTILKT